MPTPTDYTYSLANDFTTSHAVAPDRLDHEIRTSSIPTALDSISTSGDVVVIRFRDFLSDISETTLGGIVAAHSGEPLEGPPTFDNSTPVAPSVSIGSFAPTPGTSPPLIGVGVRAPISVDLEGAATVRGQALSDEGGKRDDFPGNALETALTGTLRFVQDSDVVIGKGTQFLSELSRDFYVKPDSDNNPDSWIRVARVLDNLTLQLSEPFSDTDVNGAASKTKWVTRTSGGTPGTVAVANSKVTLDSGTDSEAKVAIESFGDYGPMLVRFWAAISQRIANQKIYLGFRDDAFSPTVAAELLFEGTDDTKVKLYTLFEGAEQSTEFTIPSTGHTNAEHKYEIQVCSDYVALFIDGTEAASRHDKHIPADYDEMDVIALIDNTGVPASATTVDLDVVQFKNVDFLEVTSIFNGGLRTRS